jgi:hypothetical protein
MKLRAPPFRDAPLTLERLRETHRRLEVVPTSDPSLAYSLPVPKGWGHVSELGGCASAGRPEILGIFAPDPDLDGPRIIVSAMRLRWDVDPVEWVRHGWELAGWGIAMARPLEARWHPRFEVGGLRHVEGRTDVRRATGFIDNGRLVRVDVAGPAATWDKQHDILWPCGVLMSLVKPTYRREVEPLIHHGGPRMRFALPESWRALPQSSPLGAGSRWLATPMEGAQGSVALRIEATSWRRDRPESIEARQHRLHHELWAKGISVSHSPRRVPAGSAAGTPGLAGMYAAHARDRDERFELRFAHCDVDGWSFDYATVIASPERCPIDRMRAIRALEIAVTTTRTPPKDKPTHAA